MRPLLICHALMLLLLANQPERGKPKTQMPANNESNPKHQLYQQELDSFHANDNAPATLIAIRKQGEALWVGSQGKSHVEANKVMTATTPFRTGSITKMMTAVVIMKLKEQGKLSLEDNLAYWLPEVKHKIPSSDKITVRQLLNHTSGITDPKNDDTAYIQQLTNDPASIGNMSMKERLRRFVYNRPLHFQPGTGSHYANSGYWLLGEIINRITHKSMQQALQQFVFGPAGMAHSYYAQRQNPEVVNGYHYFGDAMINVTRWDAADGDADPSSGVISTAEDLIRFGFALFQNGLVSPRSLREMQTIATTADCGTSCSYGLGMEAWDAGPLKGFGKNGTSVGVDANLIFYPERKTCVVLFKNMGDGSRKDFLERLVRY